MSEFSVQPAKGPLGVMLVGLGAVATTFVAGVQAVRRGLAKPIGSLTQMQEIPVGDRQMPIRELVGLADLEDLRFAAWDLHGETALEAAQRSAVLEPALLDQLGTFLERLAPMPAAFSVDYVRMLNGPNVKPATGKRELAEALRADIRAFREREHCQRVIVFWTGSTEVFRQSGEAHASIEAFEAALDRDDAEISPSMLYAYAAIREGCPFINGAPHLTQDTPALTQLAHRERVPIAGKDFKTGQTLLKTVLAPMLKLRMLGLTGWFSTNILGNRDGEVLLDPDSFRSKEVTKRDVINTILSAEEYPQLYEDIFHLVRINYYPPRGDAKESWDNLDLFGWLGYPMQLKVNFLARDSILAAPLVLDLVLLTDLAQRAGLSGPQDWLGFYFKSPQGATPEARIENDVFRQHKVLCEMLCRLAGR